MIAVYKQLEELGFFKWLDEDHNLPYNRNVFSEYLDDLPSDHIHRTTINACAFRWFREKKMLGEVTPIDNWDVWGFTIHMEDIMSPFFLAHSSIHTEYKTYEEAELACLKKLIEIIKSSADGK